MARSEQIQLFLRDIVVLPRRMLLETPGVQATVPMLRGVWGAALHDLDPDVYAAVFSPGDDQPDPELAPAIEWILIGDAVGREHMLRRAWDVASGMGLGPERRRFYLRQWLVLGPHGRAQPRGSPWLLSDAVLPIVDGADQNCASSFNRKPEACAFEGKPEAPASNAARTTSAHASGLPLNERTAHVQQVSHCARGGVRVPGDGKPSHHLGRRSDGVGRLPCRLCFPAPLRLRRHGQLIEQPTLPDLIVAACRRVRAFLPDETHAGWDTLSREALELSRTVPAGPWQGSRLDLHRYSGRQKGELALHGVSGSLELPDGPGELWPLLAAAQWLHLGKATVMGLGQLCAEPS